MILCAAVYFPTSSKYVHQPKNVDHGFVILGFRHCNCFLTASLLDESLGRREVQPVQGFLTDDNRFVTRQEAAQIAKACGQVKKPLVIKGELCSEDLY